jgi:hypothetical protein
MNERIQGLAEQAGLQQRTWRSLGKDLPMWQEDPDNPGLAKFAELIVRQCIGMVLPYNEEDPCAERLYELADAIGEHFGVEL